MDEKVQDRIDKYLLGRMSAQEAKAFEDELAKDVRLREQFNYTKIVKETVCERAELERRMSAWDRQEELRRGEIHVEPVRRRKRRNNFWIWASAIAAVFVVGLFVTRPFLISKPDLQYSSIQTDDVARGGNDIAATDSLLLNKEYEKALSMIEISERELDNALAAMANTDTTDVEKREQRDYEMQEIRQRSDDLAWMKSCALIGLKRKHEALKLLDTLRKADGDYKEKADSLYNLLTK